MRANERLFRLLLGGIGVVLAILLAYLWFPPYDYSAFQNADRKVFGSVMQTLADPYYVAVDAKLRALAESRGDVVVSRDPRQRADKQLEQIYELIDAGVDGIFVGAVDWDSLQPGLEKAKAAGIPLIALGAEKYDEALMDAAVMTDFESAGVLCAQDLMRRVDAAEILLIEQTDNFSSEAFVKGFAGALAEGYHVVGTVDAGGQIAEASRVTEAFYTGHPDDPVDVIVSVNDRGAIGALRTLERHGLLDQTLVYGVDGSPEAKTAIARGLMTATVSRHPYQMAELADEAMFARLNDQPFEQELHAAIRIITAGSINKNEMTTWE